MENLKRGDEAIKFISVKCPDHLRGSVPYDVLVIKPGETGYWEGSQPDNIPDDVAISAIEGSMFGWSTPAAKLALDYMSGKRSSLSPATDKCLKIFWSEYLSRLDSRSLQHKGD